MVDRNNGQLDHGQPDDLPDARSRGGVRGRSTGKCTSVDATQYNGIYAALEQFRFGPRNGKPTAIICHGTKGHGALSDFLNKHKVTVPDRLLEQEMALQTEQRRDRVERVHRVSRPPSRLPRRRSASGSAASSSPARCASTSSDAVGDRCRSRRSSVPCMTTRVPPRNKRIQYDAAQLPRSIAPKQYAASDIVTAAMKVFARDPRVVSHRRRSRDDQRPRGRRRPRSISGAR